MPEPYNFERRRDLCSELLPRLAGVVDGSDTLDESQQTHVSSCLECQAELVRYRRLLRALHELRTQVIQPVPGLLADILAQIGERGERRAIRSLLSGRRVAYASGIAVATVAGATGALLLAGRSRSQRRAAA